MRMPRTVWLTTILGGVGFATASNATRAADLATVLLAATTASETTTPAEPTAGSEASEPPARLPEPSDTVDSAPPSVMDEAPAAPGLRFPPRILLLSGVKPDEPRAFVMIGVPPPASGIAPADRAPGRDGDAPTAVPADGPVTKPRPLQAGAEAAIDRGADPLAGAPKIDPAVTGGDAETILARMLPRRTDAPGDWFAPLEPLHVCGEPRALSPCVPPPPCHPAHPPRPYDLVGQRGVPSCGPIYGGPCEPRSGTCHDGPLAPFHRTCDRLFDVFYTPR